MSTSTFKYFSVATVGVTLLALATVNRVQAAVLTFEPGDLPANSSPTEIPQGYGGFNWTNFGYVNSPQVYPGGSGYANGTVSGSYVGFNGKELPASITRSSSFNFTGTYLSGAWNDGLNITVVGLLGGVQKFTQTVTVGTKGATWFNFNYADIDELSFSASGGQSAGYTSPDGKTSYWGSYFGMDDFTYIVEDKKPEPVPEPATILGTLAFGVVSLAARHKRKPHSLSKMTVSTDNTNP